MGHREAASIPWASLGSPPGPTQPEGALALLLQLQAPPGLASLPCCRVGRAWLSPRQATRSLTAGAEGCPEHCPPL